MSVIWTHASTHYLAADNLGSHDQGENVKFEYLNETDCEQIQRNFCRPIYDPSTLLTLDGLDLLLSERLLVKRKVRTVMYSRFENNKW
jgi:hypothetical protein